MKYLSFLLSLMVLILSSTTCFVEEKCSDFKQEKVSNEKQDKDDCGFECCSPFSKCSTCAGFVLNDFYFVTTRYTHKTEKESVIITQLPISDFPYSAWHPPKIS